MDYAAEFYASAERVMGGSTDPKVQRLATLAQRHAAESQAAHDGGDHAGASAHLSSAANYLKDAATMHTGKLSRGDFASPEVLDLAHLGKAQELHQQYVNEINKGKNNGR
jgi:hypothetical protein